MNEKFDELAKGMAQSVARRRVLKKLGVELACDTECKRKAIKSQLIHTNGLRAIFILGLLAGASAAAQQFSAWSTPVNMGPAINTPNSELHTAISSDGLVIFFVSDRPGGFGDYDLWVAQRPCRNTDWTSAQNLGPNLNTFGGELTPELSPDGHWLLFSSWGREKNENLEIYATLRSDTNDNFGWGPPMNLGKGVNSGHPNGDPSIFIDPQTGVVTLYFARLDRGGQDDWNIYQSIQGADGTFGDAVPVAELNTPYRETHPSVRRDGLEVIFTSTRPGSLGGLDLWVSTRPTTRAPWSTPLNLGPRINTEFNDRAPYLSDDGLTLILASDRPGGFGGDDLYVSTRKKLQ
jgi:hypothetical protein